MIAVSNLSKSYGAVRALHDVHFNIDAGEIVGLLGPNGAGKTTIMKTLTGYLQPDEGTVEVDGLDVLTHTLQVQKRIGYFPENAPLYPELSVQSYLKLMADLREIPPGEQLSCISEAVHSTNLESHLTRQIGHLSKGFRQRVGLAQAILHRPKLIILDEPTIGLDPTQIVDIRRLIRRLAEHSTVLFSTHILSEVEALCDRAVILINGQVRADARLSELAGSTDAFLVLRQELDGIPGELGQLDSVHEVETTRSSDGWPAFRVRGDDGAELCPAIFELAVAKQWPVRELRRDVRTLESVFNELATSESGSMANGDTE